MNVNLDYYKVFYYTAKLSSISLAAEKLAISQPAVSQSIKQLEKALGGNLFFRTPKGVKLTPEGEVLFKYIAHGYEQILLGEKKFSQMLNFDSGEIRIGASDMTLQYYLLEHIEEFHKLYPNIKIIITNGPTPETMKYLHEGKLDFGVVSSPMEEYKFFNVIPVSDIQDVFVAGTQFSELKDKTIELSTLENLPIICLEKNTSTRKSIDRFLQTNGVTLKPEIELATSALIVKFAERNFGIGYVVRNFAEESLLDGTLFELRLSKPLPQRNICIITDNRIPISQAGKKLLALLKPQHNSSLYDI